MNADEFLELQNAVSEAREGMLPLFQLCGDVKRGLIQEGLSEPTADDLAKKVIEATVIPMMGTGARAVIEFPDAQVERREEDPRSWFLAGATVALCADILVRLVT